MSSHLPPVSPSSRYVYVLIPEDRVDDVMRFLYGGDPKQGIAAFTMQEPLTLEQLIPRIYRESEPPFRRLLRFLAEHPSEPVGTSILRDQAGLPGGRGMSGMLGAYGRRSKHRYDGYWPFEKGRNPVSGETELTMSPRASEIIRSLPED